MFAPIPFDEDFSLRRATPADYDFAHTLTRSNMILDGWGHVCLILRTKYLKFGGFDL